MNKYEVYVGPILTDRLIDYLILLNQEILLILKRDFLYKHVKMRLYHLQLIEYSEEPKMKNFIS